MSAGRPALVTLALPWHVSQFSLRKRGEITMDMDMLLFEFGLLVIVGIVLLGIFRRSE